MLASGHKQKNFQMPQNNEHKPSECNGRVHKAEKLVALPQLHVEQAVKEYIFDVLVYNLRIDERQEELVSVLP